MTYEPCLGSSRGLKVWGDGGCRVLGVLRFGGLGFDGVLRFGGSRVVGFEGS